MPWRKREKDKIRRAVGNRPPLDNGEMEIEIDMTNRPDTLEEAAAKDPWLQYVDPSEVF